MSSLSTILDDNFNLLVKLELSILNNLHKGFTKYFLNTYIKEAPKDIFLYVKEGYFENALKVSKYFSYKKVIDILLDNMSIILSKSYENNIAFSYFKKIEKVLINYKDNIADVESCTTQLISKAPNADQFIEIFPEEDRVMLPAYFFKEPLPKEVFDKFKETWKETIDYMNWLRMNNLIFT